MKKSIVLLLTVLLLAASTFSSCFAEEKLPFYASITAEKVSEEPVRLVMLAFDTNPFFNQIRNGFDAVSEYLADKNATLDWISMGDMTSENIIAAIENAISMQYDSIAVISVFDGVETVIDKAVDAGIQVVTFVAEGNVPSKRMTSIGQNAKSAGKTAGEAIAEFTGGKGKVAVITGTFGAVQHEDRMSGAVDYLKENYPDIEIVGTVENNDSATTAYNQTMDFLTANPDLKCVYVTAGGPFGACQAIKEMGLTGKVGVVGFDHTPENLEYVYSGEMIAAVSQDPEGQAWNSLMMLYNNVVNGTTYDEHVATPNVVVNPENVVEYYGEAE